MWRNVFIESCILSLLVFGSLYTNAAFQKEQISGSDEKTRNWVAAQIEAHISGSRSSLAKSHPGQHVSGDETTAPSLQSNSGSGYAVPPMGVSAFQSRRFTENSPLDFHTTSK